MNKYTRRGQLTAGLQRALQGGAKVTRAGRAIVLTIGKIGVAMTAAEADNIGLALQAEAEEIRRVAKEEAEAEASKAAPTVAAPDAPAR